MANPVFNNTKEFNQQPATSFDSPWDVNQQTLDTEGRMSYDGVIAKSAALFLLAGATAVLVGMFVPFLASVFGIAAFVMSLVVAFGTRNRPIPALFAVTVALFGGAAGGISVYYEAAYGGIILQALIGTAIVFGVTLAGYKSGHFRASSKMRKFLMIAVPAYAVFSIVNFAMVSFGGFNMREVEIAGTGIPLGLVLSIFAIGLGAFMLISDFDFVDNGVRSGLDAKWEWTAAYGLVFAIIWIYLEMIRLLGYLRR